MWDFPIVIPLQVKQLYFALPWIVAICTDSSILERNMSGGGGGGGSGSGGVGLSDSNTTSGYKTLVYSALDCGNK